MSWSDYREKMLESGVLAEDTGGWAEYRRKMLEEAGIEDPAADEPAGESPAAAPGAVAGPGAGLTTAEYEELQRGLARGDQVGGGARNEVLTAAREPAGGLLAGLQRLRGKIMLAAPELAGLKGIEGKDFLNPGMLGLKVGSVAASTAGGLIDRALGSEEAEKAARGTVPVKGELLEGGEAGKTYLVSPLEMRAKEAMEMGQTAGPLRAFDSAMINTFMSLKTLGGAARINPQVQAELAGMKKSHPAAYWMGDIMGLTMALASPGIDRELFNRLPGKHLGSKVMREMEKLLPLPAASKAMVWKQFARHLGVRYSTAAAQGVINLPMFATMMRAAWGEETTVEQLKEDGKRALAWAAVMSVGTALLQDLPVAIKTNARLQKVWPEIQSRGKALRELGTMEDLGLALSKARAGAELTPNEALAVEHAQKIGQLVRQARVPGLSAYVRIPELADGAEVMSAAGRLTSGAPAGAEPGALIPTGGAPAAGGAAQPPPLPAVMPGTTPGAGAAAATGPVAAGEAAGAGRMLSDTEMESVADRVREVAKPDESGNLAVEVNGQKWYPVEVTPWGLEISPNADGSNVMVIEPAVLEQSGLIGAAPEAVAASEAEAPPAEKKVDARAARKQRNQELRAELELNEGDVVSPGKGVKLPDSQDDTYRITGFNADGTMNLIGTKTGRPVTGVNLFGADEAKAWTEQETPAGDKADLVPKAEGAASFRVKSPKVGSRNKKARGYWAVVDLERMTGGEGLQQRDRDRQASRERIEQIYREFDPEELGDSTTADRGAIVVNAKGQRIAGYGRTEVLRKVFANPDSPQYTEYRKWLEDFAGEKGVGGQLEGVKQPVLVRVATDFEGTDETEFATESNARIVQGFSEAEQAWMDAEMLGDKDLIRLLDVPASGDLSAAQNRAFWTAFAGSADAAAEMTTADGSPTPALRARMERAVLAALLRESDAQRDVVTYLVENAGDKMVNRVVKGAVSAAPELLRIRRNKPQFDLVPVLSTAIPELIRARQAVAAGEHPTVADYFNQPALFNNAPEGAKRLTMWMSEAAAIEDVRNALEKYAQTVAGIDDKTPSLFGADEVPEETLVDILTGVIDRAEAEKQIRRGEETKPQGEDDAGRAARLRDEADESGAGREGGEEAGAVEAVREQGAAPVTEPDAATDAALADMRQQFEAVTQAGAPVTDVTRDLFESFVQQIDKFSGPQLPAALQAQVDNVLSQLPKTEAAAVRAAMAGEPTAAEAEAAAEDLSGAEQPGERKRLIADAQRRGLAETRDDFIEALGGDPLKVDIQKLREFVDPDAADLLGESIEWFAKGLAEAQVKRSALNVIEARDRYERPADAGQLAWNHVHRVASEIVQQIERGELVDANAAMKKLEKAKNISLPAPVRRGPQMQQPDLFGSKDTGELGLFGERDAWQESDQEYLAAVEAGDMEIAQKMVDAAAKRAGYTVGPVYHATDDPNFTVFEGDVIHFGTEQAGLDIMSKRGGMDIDYDIERFSDGFWVYADRDYTAQGIRHGDGMGPFKTENEAKAFVKTLPKEIKPYRVFLKIRNPKQDVDAGGAGSWRVAKGVAAEKEGYDAIVYENEVEDPGSISYAVFDPSQIKSAEAVTRDGAGNVIPLSERFNPASDSILYEDAQWQESDQDALGFVSGVARAIEGIDFRAMPAAELMARLSKTAGVKQEELEDLGLQEYLEGIEGKVTKQQVLEFVRNGGPQIKEVVKGQRIIDDILPDGWTVKQNKFGLWNVYNQNDAPVGTPMKTREQALHTVKGVSADPTKYAQYQLAGGENYREVLLTLPVESDPNLWPHVREAKRELDAIHNRMMQRQVQAGDAARREELEKIIDDAGSAWRGRGHDVFRTSHFDEPNILAHVRMNDRTDADGRRTMFIEEIQSDWHQMGRKGGYAVPPKLQWRTGQDGAFRAEVDSTWFMIKPTPSYKDGSPAFNLYVNGDMQEQFPTLGAAKNDAQGWINETKVGAVPDAPFKKSWPLLTFKRVLRMAAEQGYDAVAWTPGEVQADRYSLRHKVDYISAAPVPVIPGEVYVDVIAPAAVFNFRVDKKTGKITEQKGDTRLDRVVGQPLAEVIGKDLAAKVLAVEDQTRFEGEDLEIGGKGMKGFYDKMLPSAVGRYVRKLDKAVKVGQTEIRQYVSDDDLDMGWESEATDAEREELARTGKVGGPTVQAWSLPITDAMRDRIMGGQLLYEREGYRHEQRESGEAETNRRLAREAVSGLHSGRSVAGGTGGGSGGLRPGRVEIVAGGFTQAWRERSAAILKERGTLSLVGELMRTPDDIMAVSDICRNPKFEVARTFWLKDGQIVHEEAVSCRLPGSTMFARGDGDSAEFAAHVRTVAALTGADSVMLHHNHPSGDTRPSQPDMASTVRIVDALRGSGVKFAGHVVGNHKRYTLINELGEYREARFTHDIDTLRRPDRPHVLLGKKAASPSALAHAVKGLQVREERAVVIGLGAAGEIQGIGEIHAESWKQPKAAMAGLRRFARATGAPSVVLANVDRGEMSEEVELALMTAIENGTLRDVVFSDGSGLAGAGVKRASRAVNFGLYARGAEFFMEDEGYHAEPVLNLTAEDFKEAGIIKRINEGVKSFTRLWLQAGSQRGGARRYITREREAYEGRLESGTFLDRRLAKELNSVMTRLDKSLGGELAESARAEVEGVLKGLLPIEEMKTPAAVKAAPLIRAARLKLDRMSGALLMKGIPPENMKLTIEKNLGKWVLRAYAKYETAGYKPTPEQSAAAAGVVELEIMERIQGVVDKLNRGLEKAQKGVDAVTLRDVASFVATGDPLLLEGMDEKPAKLAEYMRTVYGALNDEFNRRLEAATDENGQIEIAVDPEYMEAAIRGTLDYILNKGTRPWEVAHTRRGGGVTQDRRSFLARKDIPQELREFMGEVHDPALLYQMSAMRLRRTLAAYDFQGKILQISDSFEDENPQKVFYRGRAYVDKRGHAYSVKIPTSEVYGPLGGLYTDRETFEVVKGIAEPQTNAVVKWYMRVLTAPRFTKVVLNLPTQQRNFISNFLNQMAHGEMLYPKTYAGAWVRTTALAANAARSKPEANKEWARLLEIALMTGSAHGTPIREDLRDAFQNMEGLTPQQFTNKLLKMVAQGGKFATAAYALGDNIPKIASYYAVRERYLPIFQERLRGAEVGDTIVGLQDRYTVVARPGQNLVRLRDRDGVEQDFTPESLTDREAVADIRSSFPYYDMAPKLITDVWRRSPLGPDFMLFHVEQARVMMNNYRNAVHKARHFGDFRTMLGVMAAHSVAATRASAMWSPWILAAAALLRLIGARRPDKKEEDAIRALQPPYRANNVQGMWNKDGKWKYMDIGYIHPYDLASIALMSAQAATGRKLETLQQGVAEFFGGGTMAGRMFAEVVANSDEFGRPIAMDDDPAVTKGIKRAAHVARGFAPDFVMQNLEALELALADEVRINRAGEVATVSEKLLRGTLPVRIFDFDAERALEFRARALARIVHDRKGEANRIWREYWRGYTSEKRADKAVETARERLHEYAAKRLKLYVDAARSLDMTESDIQRTLKDAGWAEYELDWFFEYGEIPYEVPDMSGQ